MISASSAIRRVPPAAVLAAGLAWGIHQQRLLESSRLALSELRARQASMSALPEERRAPDNPEESAELVRLREARLELLRLRGIMEDLRRTARLMTNAGADDLPRIHALAEATEREARLITERRKAEEVRKKTHEALRETGHLVRELQFRAGWSLRSWADLEQALQQPWDEEREANRWVWRAKWESLQSGAVTPSQFELLPVPPGVDHRDAESASRTLILRERNPRPQPDGTFARAYLFLDNGSTEARSPDGHFDAYEQSPHRE